MTVPDPQALSIDPPAVSRTARRRLAPARHAAGSARLPRGRDRATGWTSVEVLVALAIAGLLAGLAVPAFRDWLAMQATLNEARRLTDSLHLARSEAIKSGYRVNVCKSTDRLHCTKAGGWETGYIVYADTSRDGTVDPDEPLVRVEGPAPSGISIRANHPLDNYVSFTSLGRARLLNGALQMGTFTLCRDGRRAYRDRPREFRPRAHRQGDGNLQLNAAHDIRPDAGSRGSVRRPGKRNPRRAAGDSWYAVRLPEAAAPPESGMRASAESGRRDPVSWSW